MNLATVVLFTAAVLVTLPSPNSCSIVVVAFSIHRITAQEARFPIRSPIMALQQEARSANEWIVSSLNDGGSAEEDPSPPPVSNSDATSKEIATRLILHFDINETILLGDDAGGDTRHESVQKMLAKSAFCRMPEETNSRDDETTETQWDQTQQMEPTHWWNGQRIEAAETVLKAREMSSNPSSPVLSSPPPPLYTGWEWPPGCCPYYRTAFKRYAKAFVDGDPGHGTIYQPILEACEEALAKNYNDDGGPGNHILPAFYQTLYHLIQQQQQDTANTFTVIFRTFGSDLDEIASLVTAFATGRHPDYGNVDYPPLCLSSDNLYQGRWKEITSTTDTNEAVSTTTTTTIYQLWNRDETQLVASGDAEILAFLKQQTVCGIRDDYDYWKDHGYDPTAGKPVWVPRYDDPTTATTRYDHHLLFDDNIHNLPHDGIACVRQEQVDGTFVSVDGAILHNLEQGYQGVHLIRVPTVEPVLNPNWYIQQIRKARIRLNRILTSAASSSNEK